MDRKKGGADGSVEAAGGIVPEPALAGSHGRGAAANADDPQPDRSQATSTTSGRKGGGA